MKKNILFIMLTLFAAINSLSAKTFDISSMNSNMRIIIVHVNFSVASPKSGCSSFPGICKMTAGADLPKTIPSGLNCNADATYENGALSIEILYADMSDELKSNFSRLSYFPIDEPVNLSSTVLRSLGAPSYAALQVGKSIIVKGNDRIKFTLILK